MASITKEKTSIRGIIGRKHKAKLSFVRQEAVSSHEIIARSRGVVKGGGSKGERALQIFGATKIIVFSRFLLIVLDGVLGSPRLVCHTCWCPCISVVPEASHEAS